MKISFDFDSTLAEIRQQKIAKKFIECGNDVWIVTSRSGLNFPEIDKSPQNSCVFTVADFLGIKRDKILFTNGKDKWQFLSSFDLHFDDDVVEIELIEQHLHNCVGVLIFDE